MEAIGKKLIKEALKENEMGDATKSGAAAKCVKEALEKGNVNEAHKCIDKYFPTKKYKKGEEDGWIIKEREIAQNLKVLITEWYEDDKSSIEKECILRALQEGNIIKAISTYDACVEEAQE